MKREKVSAMSVCSVHTFLKQPMLKAEAVWAQRERAKQAGLAYLAVCVRVAASNSEVLTKEVSSRSTSSVQFLRDLNPDFKSECRYN